MRAIQGKLGLTTKVSPQHKIQDEEAVFVILEGIPQVHDEWVVDLGRGPISGSGKVGMENQPLPEDGALE
jgi:hypothetical protein